MIRNSIRCMMRAAVLSVMDYAEGERKVSEVFTHEDLSSIPEDSFVTMTYKIKKFSGKLEPFEGEGVA
jgi:hypothetical protein